MRIHLLHLAAPLVILLGADALVGQDPATSPPRSAVAFDAPQRVPLHTAPAGDDADEYGWWAAGPNWKASFHDGLAFYPYRGPDRPLVCMQWRTQSITIGGEPLSLEPRGVETSAERYVTRYPDVHEVYELRDEGVEQLFVIPHRPQHSGDLVVSGRVAGDLHVADRAPAHAPLLFADGGEDTVRYGRAFAFDAAGRRAAISTSVEQGVVRLHVPAAFVDAAEFPLTIDPLVASTLLNLNSSSAPVLSPALATSTSLDHMVIAYVREFAANDRDAYALVGPTDYSGMYYWWTDLSSAYQVPEVDVAYLAGAGRYVIAFTRDSGVKASPHAYQVLESQPQLNGGDIRNLEGVNPGTFYSQPSIGGGNGTCSKAMIAFTLDDGGTKSLECHMLTYGTSVSGHITLSPEPLSNQSASEEPDVMPVTKDGQSWRIVWRSTVGAQQEIRTLLLGNGTVATGFEILESSASALGNPQVAGCYDDQDVLRSIVVWEKASLFNKSVRVTDFSGGPLRTILSGSQLRLGDAVADATTGANFLLSHSAVLGSGRTHYLSRLGGSGGLVDTEAVGPAGLIGAVGMCFEQAGEPDYLVAYGETGALRPLRGTRFEYPAAAVSIGYGTGCSSAWRTAAHPFAGNHNFSIDVGNLAPNTPVVLAVGWSASSVPLAVLGIPCSLLVSLTGLETLIGISGSSEVSFPIALPDDPVFIGDLYVQAVMPFHGEASNARRVQVR